MRSRRTRSTFIAACVVVIGLVFAAASAGPAEAQSPWSEQNPGIYPTNSNPNVGEVQFSLLFSRCYGNQLRWGEVDGDVGEHTKKAIDIFVNEYNRSRRPGEKAITSFNDLLEKLRDKERTVAGNVRFCERSRYRELYFTSAREHIGWIPIPDIVKLYPPNPLVLRMKVALEQNGCYGGVVLSTAEHPRDWGPFSRKAMHVFVRQYHKQYDQRARLRTPQQALEAAENEALAATERFCRNSTFLREYFFPGTSQVGGADDRCELPRAADTWLSSLGKSNKQFKLSTALKDLEEAFDGFLTEIDEPDEKKAVPLGVFEQMRDARVDLYLQIESVLKTKKKLSLYGAVLNNDYCTRCMLLSSYDLLMTIASPPRSGQRSLNYKSQGVALSINISDLDFDTLKLSRETIQIWGAALKTLDEKKTALLEDKSGSGEVAQNFADAARRAEQAKEEMLDMLYKAPKVRKGEVTTFASQRDLFCIGDIELAEKSDDKSDAK